MHVRGVYLSVEITGPPDGPAVVLLHAFPLSKQMWALTVPALAGAGWRTVTLDFRGFGLSEAPPGPYGMAALAEDVVAVLDQLEIARAVLGGLSMGGYVLFEVLRQASDVVRAALFCDTRADPDTPAGRDGRHRAVAQVQSGRAGREEYLAGLLAKLLGATTLADRPAVVAAVQRIVATTPDAGLVGALLGMAGRADHTATLGVLRAQKIPALFLAGEEDGITGVEVARAMGAAVPGATVVALPRAGHLTALEVPDAFNAAVLEFLGRLPPER
ncbi:MAG TPA: alpha/beta fold hydrolase [Myxococcota bacterium]|nr:alpha/beta fold hydrolase [Myxococcota bacterium]